jgi:hypothetical protein
VTLDPKEYAMVRQTMTVLALIGCLILTGCSLIPLPLPFGQSRGAGASEVPEVGVCLADANGYDSDRRSVVECTEPHLYDVVGSAEWPGMDDAIADEGSEKAVFDLIIANEPGSVVDAYATWANEFCATALRDTVGWSTRVTDELWVMPAVAYQIDRSLASRSDFVAGDHVTLCSAAWWEPLAYDAGVTVASMLEAEFPLDTRECWVETEESFEFASCDEPHTDQTVLRFEGQAAFGIDFIQAPEEMTDDDWGVVSDKCWALASLLLPTFDADTMYTWPSADGEVWEELASADADPDQPYFFACDIAMYDGSSFTGDVFGSTIEPAVSGGSGSSSNA